MKFNIKEIKNSPKTTGVYKIYFKNSENNNVYIGSCSNKNGFYDRWKSHKSALVKNKKHNPILQHAYNKYGKENIIFEIIEECEPSLCLEREQYYIDLYDSYNNGYNARPLSSNNGGFIHSEETKLKIFNRYKSIRDSYCEQVNSLYKEGKTTREICKILNISRNFLRKIFKENNIIGKKESGLKKRKVYQYDMNGNFIQNFECVNECVRLLGVNIHGIFTVLSGQCKHYKNFYYSYNYLTPDEVLNNINRLIIKSKNVKYKNIKQVDTDGNIIKVWRDIKEIIQNNLDYKYFHINRSLRLNKISYGFYWIN